MTIQSFSCFDTESFFRTGVHSNFQHIKKPLTRKLSMLDSAVSLRDIDLPGNCLHKLCKEKRGKYSIKINDQYRLCFCWTEAGPTDVEVIDYH